VQPCREVLKLVEIPNQGVLERGEEVKGALLLLGEAFHPVAFGTMPPAYKQNNTTSWHVYHAPYEGEKEWPDQILAAALYDRLA
jgi:hypothetical protein